MDKEYSGAVSFQNLQVSQDRQKDASELPWKEGNSKGLSSQCVPRSCGRQEQGLMTRDTEMMGGCIEHSG